MRYYYYYFIISSTTTTTSAVAVAVVAAEKCWFIFQILLMRSTPIIYNLYHSHSNRISLGFIHLTRPTIKRVRGPKLKFITKCINNNNNKDSSSSSNSRSNSSRRIKKKRKWWQEFFFDDEGNWLFLKDDDMLLEDNYDDMDTYISSGSTSNEAKDEESQKFEAWKRRAEAITELREAQEDMRNEENRRWEDWLQEVNDTSSNESANGEDASSSSSSSSWDFNGNGFVKKSIEDARADPTSELIPEGGGLVKSLREFVLGKDEEEDDDEMLYEDRVFRYASLNSAKFLAVLVIIPWAMDFLVHDYVLLPFLDRYVKTVPLAAELLDVRKHQKLEMVKELNTLKARFRLEVEIGKSPPLSDEETWLELRHKALELRDEWRLENRKAFANIWSDMVFGITLFLLLYFNQNQVALLKFTGYKILNNITDTGKAVLIILITDIFLGYHSESGWETLLEILVDHYGLVVDEAAITLFVCLVPVIIDACVKLWLFKYLPRLSPRVSNIFREMKRH